MLSKDVVKEELTHFVNNWNITSTQAHTTAQLVSAYLACSLDTNWQLVYGLTDPVVPSELLLYDAHKAGSRPARFSRRQQSPSFLLSLFEGATLGEEARSNVVWKDYLQMTERVPSVVRTDNASLLLFFLAASGIPNINMFLCDPSMQWIVKPGYDRTALCARLRELRALLSRVSIAPPLAMFICSIASELPSTSSYEWKDFVPLARVIVTKPSSTKASLASSFPFVVVQPPPWDIGVERSFAEEPVYRQYKKDHGWPSYYDSRDTIKAFIREPPTSYVDSTMGTPEIVQLARHLAQHANPAILTDTEQGLAFSNASRRCISHSVCQQWTTVNVLHRLFLVHHPHWKEIYAYEWGPDLTLESELNTYLAHYSSLSEQMIDWLFVSGDPKK